MADLDTPTLTRNQVHQIVDCAYYAFMAGWSHASSMANVRDYYDDDPMIQADFPDRNLFLAVAHRAIRGYYNDNLLDTNDIVNYVHRAYGG